MESVGQLLDKYRTIIVSDTVSDMGRPLNRSISASKVLIIASFSSVPFHSIADLLLSVQETMPIYISALRYLFMVFMQVSSISSPAFNILWPMQGAQLGWLSPPNLHLALVEKCQPNFWLVSLGLRLRQPELNQTLFYVNFVPVHFINLTNLVNWQEYQDIIPSSYKWLYVLQIQFFDN